MNKKNLKFGLKAVLTLVFLTWAFYSVNWREFFDYIRKISVWQLALYLAVVVSGIWISSHKWKMLAQFKDIKISQWDAFKYYFAGTFINNFMPSFIGGDTFRAYQIGKPQKKYTEAISSVMMDRFTGLVAAMLLGLTFSAINYKAVLENPVLIIINAVIIIVLVVEVSLVRIKNISVIRKTVRRYLPEKVVKLLKDIETYDDNLQILVKSISWGVVFSVWGMALSNYILFMSLGIKISVINYLTVIFLITIISSVPLTINNIGIKEWAYVTFFGLFGISSSSAIAVAILSRLLQTILSFLALPIYIQSKKGLKDIGIISAEE
jgi:hypothetical protein